MRRRGLDPSQGCRWLCEGSQRRSHELPLICQLTAVSCGCESHRGSKTACLKLLPFGGASCAKLIQMCSSVGDELVQCWQIGVSQCLLKQLSGCLAPKPYLPLVRESSEVSAYVCVLILLGTATGTTAAATRREWECPSLEDLYCNNVTLSMYILAIC